MQPADIKEYINKLRPRSTELESQMADPEICGDHRRMRRISAEHRKLSSLFTDYEAWVNALDSIEENNQMLQEESDEELRELAAAEIEELQQQSTVLEKRVQFSLLPPDPNEGRNLIVEIRPAAGGDEAGLFAAELFRAYCRYAEHKNWKLEILEQSNNALGGLKNAAFSLAGDDVFSQMKYESGVHRVQRVPVTESGGRTHTSTITVSVLPEAEEVDVQINPEDLRFDVFRASGPGGQSVNTTDSAVRVTHIPSNLVVISQQEKSQHRNKEIAMRILRSRLFEMRQREEAEKLAAGKRAQVGTGDRSERIRTYNFPQNRITDHRFGVTIHDIPGLMEGNFSRLFEEIIAVDCENQLANLA